jgi:hypothetical protein
MDAPDNLVRISKYQHEQISGIYQRPDPELGRMTPREFLHGKSWEERYQFGLRVLEKVGDLKP